MSGKPSLYLPDNPTEAVYTEFWLARAAHSEKFLNNRLAAKDNSKLLAANPQLVADIAERFEELLSHATGWEEITKMRDLLWYEKGAMLRLLAYDLPSEQCLAQFGETEKLYERLQAFLNILNQHWRGREKPDKLLVFTEPNTDYFQICVRMRKHCDIFYSDDLRFFMRSYETQEKIKQHTLKHEPYAPTEYADDLTAMAGSALNKLSEAYRTAWDRGHDDGHPAPKHAYAGLVI